MFFPEVEAEFAIDEKQAFGIKFLWISELVALWYAEGNKISPFSKL